MHSPKPKPEEKSKWVDIDWDEYVKMEKWKREQPHVFGNCKPDDNEYTRALRYADIQEQLNKGRKPE